MTNSQTHYPADNRRKSTRLGIHTKNSSEGTRAGQLADIAESGDEDNAEIAAAELRREYPDFAR